jgi:solute carrier family 31 (copper transporter), member 1
MLSSLPIQVVMPPGKKDGNQVLIQANISINLNLECGPASGWSHIEDVELRCSCFLDSLVNVPAGIGAQMQTKFSHGLTLELGYRHLPTTQADPRLGISTFITSQTVKMQTSMPDGSAVSTGMMMPWLHFTGGDYLFFRSWHPTSSGAIAGACIGLVLLAIFERWVTASRYVLESHWRQQCVLLCFIAAAFFSNQPCDRSLVLTSQPGTANFAEKSDQKGVEEESRQYISNHPINAKRIIPPFIPMHDIPRGLIQAGQSLLAYILMLAVM